MRKVISEVGGEDAKYYLAFLNGILVPMAYGADEEKGEVYAYKVSYAMVDGDKTQYYLERQRVLNQDGSPKYDDAGEEVWLPIPHVLTGNVVLVDIRGVDMADLYRARAGKDITVKDCREYLAAKRGGTPWQS